MKSLTNPIVDLVGVFVLFGFVIWLLNAVDASASVVVAALVVICGLAGIAGGRFADHIGLLR